MAIEPGKTHSAKLGESVDLANDFLRRHGWLPTIHHYRPPSDIHPSIQDLPHPAAPYLDRIRRFGAPVVLSSAPPSREELQRRMDRGPHQSALEYKEFLAEEFLDFIKKGYWIVLPWDSVKDIPGICISPVGCVPQQD